MTNNKNRNKYSLYNAISAIGLTLVNGLLGIVVTRFIIGSFGSDFNGLNSTANQIVNMLLILEGGFTLASNVALFDPLGHADYSTVNGLLAATRKKFHSIGCIFLAIGAIIAIVYCNVVNSALPKEFIATVVMMTIVPAAFNLFYATTYRVLLQGQQKEFIINIITMSTIGLGHLANIIMILQNGPMWMVRFNTMMFSFINSILIAIYVKRKNKFLKLNVPAQKELIKGTGDVMVQKITGVVYNSAPIVFLSVSPSGGTALASVYAVYNSIFVMVKSLLHSIIDAPRHGFGQLLTERKREDIWPIYAQYEYIAFCAVFVLLTTCCALILPFIRLYTYGINDANYYDYTIAILMVLISAIEMIHIPSGHLINMSGNFRISRNFQLIACITLLITMIIGGTFWGVYGMLFSLLCVAILLAILEMGYIHIHFFKNKLCALLRLLLPMIIVGILICLFEIKLPLYINSYFIFIIYGILFVGLNTAIALLTGFIFNRQQLSALLKRIKKILFKK